jgi:hypothetical protein
MQACRKLTEYLVLHSNSQFQRLRAYPAAEKDRRRSDASGKPQASAASLASQVEKLVGVKPKLSDFWKNATMAEVQLLKQDYAEAIELCREAVADASEQVGSDRTEPKIPAGQKSR